VVYLDKRGGLEEDSDSLKQAISRRSAGRLRMLLLVLVLTLTRRMIEPTGHFGSDRPGNERNERASVFYS